MPEEKKSSPFLVWGTLAVLVAVVAYGAMRYTKKEEVVVDPMQRPATAENPVAPAPTPIPVVSQSKYKDGVYSSDGAYISPAGDEKINVSLTLKGDVISDVTVKALATVAASKNWQGKFIEGVKSQVVGKKLDEVSLTKVSGSSLTPKGWNDAVSKIMVSAKS